MLKHNQTCLKHTEFTSKTEEAFKAIQTLSVACGATVECLDKGKVMKVNWTFPKGEDIYQGGGFSYLMASLDDPEVQQEIGLVSPSRSRYEDRVVMDDAQTTQCQQAQACALPSGQGSLPPLADRVDIHIQQGDLPKPQVTTMTLDTLPDLDLINVVNYLIQQKEAGYFD